MLMQRKVLLVVSVVVLAVAVGLVWVNNDREEKPARAQESATPAATTIIDLTTPPFFDGNNAYSNAAMLMDFGPRTTGSEASRRAGDAIIERLEAAGWGVIIQEFNHEAAGVVYPVRNIIGRRGEGQVTILGSHYDSRIWADNDANVDNRQMPVPGANDGASSTGVLLEFADVIDQYYDLNGQLWLAFFDAEDNGHIPGWDWILGSRYMAQHLEDYGITPEDVELMILFDMVGEGDADDGQPTDDGLFWTTEQIFRQEGYSMAQAPAQTNAIWQLAAEMGLIDVFVPETRGSIIDDHLPFLERGIPAVDIIDLDYPYWHTTHDTLDKISATSLARAGQVVELYLVRTNLLRVKSE
jgi:glutaminyl-peptide cyclotransferase